MAPSFVTNGGVAAVKTTPFAGRLASVYSEVQTSRIDHALPVPSVLRSPFKIVDGPASSAAGNPDEIAKLFPNLFGQPSSMLVPNGIDSIGSDQKLKIGVVLSGGQAPGGHNVICGIFDYLQERAPGSTLYGFRGGPAGVMKGKYVELTADYIYPYRNQGGFDMICSGRDKIETPEQFKQAEETAAKLDLDGLVVIGGDDSNTNACLLAENFRSKNLKTRVIGCPKTIDGDLKCKEVPTSFGFDTACKIYAEMIGNVMIDARSTGKYYHFVRLMGRAASHITLECALQTHPNITIIGEEVAAKKLTLKNVTDYMVDVICKRAELGYNYGVILIPEGLIDFIPEVAKIETEKMLIQMVETELEKRKQEGSYKANFKGQSHFFGYEGRCGLPTNFDASYCYALGYGAGALLHSGKTGLISSVGNLCAPVEEWTVGGTALTSMMDVERRHGKLKPVIKKAMVELDGAPFKKFASLREEWAIKNCYISPGPIQFAGPASNAVNHTLLLELGAQA
ncbi:Pyrophosphate--fructose 6-phosphate 1-phosphotransferase subunit beta [Gossypium arboreum]|uniref:Pyrophosphate--fructose 6-phosphate 1-phosphotransferase subunit beta n=1 Tax=Gossypium arboreum TaxID=29729 RepID=A0A0B0NX31_GOSAR|nr:Pyrophosphate--fructose 6-phosphate 1-phosphotransferase subunit beta [Gossypium arboreum]